jgi:starch synthase
MRIVFISPEGVPFSKTGGLADVVGALPKALGAAGHQVELLLPRHRMTKPGKTMPPLRSLTVPLPSGLKFAAIQDGGDVGGVRAHLVEMPEFFDRDQLYTEKGKDYPDNHLRFASFCLASIEFLKRFAEPPDVIHCHDWQSALVPIYLRNMYQNDRFFENTPVVFTIHNLGYQGLFAPQTLPEIGLHPRLFTVEYLEFYGKVNLLKGGILFSDFVTTVSRKYAEEIQTPEYGCGLEGVLKSRGDRLQGILNGVDYEDWSPRTDKFIPAQFAPEDLKGKDVCKKTLLEKMGAAKPVLERPVIGIVSRFAAQKGFDLIAEIGERLMAMDLYIVALGAGEPKYEEIFRSLAAKYPDKFLVKVAYDNALAHQIEAGSDMFLMPSRYEPCGLNQIYSLKYGTVPVVRATGGLDDTIEAFNGKTGTGFKFTEYSADALLGAIQEAVAAYRQPKVWRQIMLNGMKKDYSWAASAKQYLRVYQSVRKPKARAKTDTDASNPAG